MLMKIGYARVSTPDQSLYMQKQALKQAGCEKIFSDTASGVRSDRIGLDKAMADLRSGDTLVVWKLDRLGRSLQNLIQLIKQLKDNKNCLGSLAIYICFVIHIIDFK